MIALKYLNIGQFNFVRTLTTSMWHHNDSTDPGVAKAFGLNGSNRLGVILIYRIGRQNLY